MIDGSHQPITRHRVRWGVHEELMKEWDKAPPVHPENPRYRAREIEVEGQYSLFESVVNIFRRKGWLDAPPADFKWAVLTVRYEAPEDVMDRFSNLGMQGA